MFHLSAKTISRAAGRSATAAIAYRTGTRVVDERTGEIHDYTKKKGVEYCGIILPGAAPSWANDRTQLWNEAELAEKRINSTVAREFELGIPNELTRTQSIELVRDFTEQLVAKHGFAADFAIHKDDPRKWDGTEKGFDGYHAHVLCTTRRLTHAGLGEKTRELDGMRTGRESIEYWRERWALTANKHLEFAGKSQRIDHRSLKEQGIDREPSQHLGPTATTLERRGCKTLAGNANRRIEAAYLQGIADRQAVMLAEKELFILDQNIKRALEIRDQNLTEFIDRKAAMVSARPVVFVDHSTANATTPREFERNEAMPSDKSIPGNNRWSAQKGLQQKLAVIGRQSLKDRGIITDLETGAPKNYPAVDKAPEL